MLKKQNQSVASLIAATLVVLAAIYAAVYGISPKQPTEISALFYVAPNDPPQGPTGSEESASASIRGVLLDESDKPIAGIMVSLIPAEKTGNARWYATKHEWTDKLGEYYFGGLQLGEYLVAVHDEGAPDAAYPFATAYYRGVEAEADAERVLLATSGRRNLNLMRLRRIGTATIDVTVRWDDGDLVERSNLLFHNLSYPRQAVIGDVAPQITNGRGQFTLPVGFEYYARAKVDCDVGTKIETRESRPVQQIKIEYGLSVKDLTFVIPGPKCQLWSPSKR